MVFRLSHFFPTPWAIQGVFKAILENVLYWEDSIHQAPSRQLLWRAGECVDIHNTLQWWEGIRRKARTAIRLFQCLKAFSPRAHDNNWNAIYIVNVFRQDVEIQYSIIRRNIDFYLNQLVIIANSLIKRRNKGLTLTYKCLFGVIYTVPFWNEVILSGGTFLGGSSLYWREIEAGISLALILHTEGIESLRFFRVLSIQLLLALFLVICSLDRHTSICRLT